METKNISLKRFIKGRDASPAIEFAVIFPVFLLMMIGAIEMGLVLWGRTSMNYAASMAARHAFVHATTVSDSDVVAYAQNLVPASSPGFNFSFTATLTPNVTAVVTGTLNYTWIVLPLSNLTVTERVTQPLRAS